MVAPVVAVKTAYGATIDNKDDIGQRWLVLLNQSVAVIDISF